MYENAEITLDTLEDTSVMIFTLIGDVYVGGERIKEQTAVKLTSGNELIIKNADKCGISRKNGKTDLSELKEYI